MAVKKGSTGKSYEQDKDKIKVTYSDGSTRTVWKSDASYATTKKAMEADTKSYKKTKTAGTSKVNATNALGEGVTAGRGIVANAQVSQKAAAAKTAKANSTYEKEKKAKQQGYKAKNNSALEQAKQLNSQVRNVQAQQTNEFAKGITPRSLKAGTVLAGQQIKSGTKAGLISGSAEVGRGGNVEGNNFAATADIIRKAMGNKNSSLYANQNNINKNIDTWYGVNQRKLALQSAKEQQAIADRYNMSDFNKGEKLVSDLVSTTGAMAPMVALSAVNPLAGAAYMTNMSRGAGELQALQENPFTSNDTARLYGLGNAGIEMGTEYLTGGLAKVPGAIKLGDMAGKAVEGIGNPLLKTVAKSAGDIAGEAGEEMLSEAVNPFLQRMTYNPDAENASAKDIAYAGLLGGLGAGVINGTVNLAGRAASAGANRQNQPFSVQNMIKNAQNQGESSQNAQNAPQQENANTATNPISNAQNAPQNQTSEANFQQNQQNFQQGYQKASDEVRDYAYGLLMDYNDDYPHRPPEVIERLENGLYGKMTDYEIETALSDILTGNPSGKVDSSIVQRVETAISDYLNERNQQEGARPQPENVQVQQENVQNPADNVRTPEQNVQPTEIVRERTDESTLSDKSRRFVEDARRASGMGIDLFNGTRTDENGSYSRSDDRIRVNAGKLMQTVNADENLRGTVGHELYHGTWGTDEHKYIQDLAVSDRLATHPGETKEQATNNLLNEIIDTYTNYGSIESLMTEDGKIDIEKVWDEVGAKYIENVLRDEAAAERIVRTDVSTARKILEFIGRKLQEFKNIFTMTDAQKQQYELYRKAEITMRRALSNHRASAESAVEEVANSTAVSTQPVSELSTDGRNAGIVSDAKGNPVAWNTKDGVMFNKHTYDYGGKKELNKYLNKMVRTGRFSQQDASEIIDFMEFVNNEVTALMNGEKADQFVYFKEWQDEIPILSVDGKPVLSLVKKNGEYEMNLDFSQRCTKRVAMDKLLQHLATNTQFDISELGMNDFVTINNVLSEQGFLTACKMCYVETKRYRNGEYATKVANEFNEILDAANIQNGVPDEKAMLAKAEEIAARDGSSFTTVKGWVDIIMADPSKVRKLDPQEIMYSDGMEKLKAENPALHNKVTHRSGSASPKAMEGEAPYNSEMFGKNLPDPMSTDASVQSQLDPTRWSTDRAFQIGGVRLQSFSDYRANMFFDYCQMFADIAARRLPVHSYTKVEDFVRLFGQTGAKINMSVIPRVDITPEDRAYFDTLSDKKKKTDERYLAAKARAGLDANGEPIWADESFPYDIALEIQKDPRYSNNCGTTAIGFSDAHIWKMLSDPNIRMIIPYHKSGINPGVARGENIDLANDYTYSQNPTKAKEAKLDSETWPEYYSRITQKTQYGTKEEGYTGIDFYETLYDTEDPVETSMLYVEACQKDGIIPKFPQFVYMPDGSFNPNYYKLLVDFTVFNESGAFAPQQVVRWGKDSLPEEWRDLVVDSVSREKANEDKINAEIGVAADNLLNALGENHPGMRNDVMKSVDDSGFTYRDDADRFNAMADEYGTIPRGADPYGNNRDIDVPASTDGQDKTRRFIRTGMEAEQVADETVQAMQNRMTSDYYDGKMSYTPISNAETVQMANDELNTALKNNLDAGMSPDQARQKVLDDGYSEFHGKVIGNELPSATEVAKAERLIQIAQDAGDYQRAADIIIDMSVVGTQLGQAMQAYSMLKRLSPQGQLMALQRSIDRMNKMQTKKGADKIKLPEGFAAEYLSARSNAKREELADQAFKEAAQQLEGTWADKINAYRYSCMLCNPATHARNLISNGVMGIAGKVGDSASALMQDAIIGKGEKTRSFKKGRKYTPEERAQLHQLVEDMWNDSGSKTLGEGGSKYDNTTSAIEQNKRIFKSDILENTIGNGKFSVSSALEAEDMLFKGIHYKDTLMDYLQANGFTPQEIKQAIADGRNIEKPNGASLYRGVAYAESMARKRTFTEDNKVSNWLNEGAKLKAGNLPVGEVLLGGIIPYRRTPLNIMVRGIEYSPAGLAMTLLHKAMHVDSNATLDASNKNGTYTVAEVLDSLGANLSGTAIFILGVYMQANGLLNGSGDDDKKKQNFDRATGRQEFSVNTPGGGTATIDWLSPAAMPLLAGAATFESLTTEEKNMDAGTLSRVLENLARISDPAFEMSCMQGVTEALSSYNSGVSGATSALWSGVSSYGGQFVPNVVKKVAYAIDDTKRSTYSPKNSPLTKSGAKFEKGIRGGLPLVSKTLQPKIDMWGNDEQRDIENKGWRLISGLVNPTNYKSNRKGKVENELERLYNEVGESSVFPSSTQGYVQYRNENLYMNEDEYTEYARTKGKNSYKYVAEFMQTPEYNEMSDTEKVTVIEKLYNVANYQAKKEFVNGYDGAEFVPDTQYENPLTYKDGVVKYCMAKTGAFAGSNYNVEEIDRFKAAASEAGLSNETYMDIRSNITGKDDEGNNLSKDYKKAYLTEQRNNGTLTGKQYWTIYLNNVTPSAADITQCGNELGRDSELFQRYKKEYNASHKKQVR